MCWAVSDLRGYDVTYVQNYTDIDDKILNRANEEGGSMQAVRNATSKPLKSIWGLNILPADRMPRATCCIDGIQQLIREPKPKARPTALMAMSTSPLPVTTTASSAAASQ